MRVESYFASGADFFVAGLVTFAKNGPPVGIYGIFSLQDGGRGGKGDSITFAEGFLPVTALEIAESFPIRPAPDELIAAHLGGYQELLAGNITIH